MTLPVPLTVRVGDRHITQQVRSLSFRKEAIGGLRSISFSLARPLSDLEGMDPLSKVYVYDGRSAKTVADGRLADTGRGAGSDGQRWDCVAFGPAQTASDVAAPMVFVDRSISDGWRLVDITSPAPTASVTTKPGDITAAAPQGILLAYPDGTPVVTTSRCVYRYDRLWQSGQKLGGLSFGWDSGTTTLTWQLQAITRTDANDATGEAAWTAHFDTAGGVGSANVVTNFPNGRNTVELRIFLVGSAGTVTGDAIWGWFDTVTIRPILVDKTGTERTGSYLPAYVYAHEVVEDLLGRHLPEFDGAGAVVDSTSAQQIGSLAYPDGVTPEQVLTDLMAVVPAYRWYTTPDATGNGYGFRWELWPTTVRYEATLDDGGSFPLSTQSVYNRVKVRWKDAEGTTRWTHLSKACPLLDDKGIVRSQVIDLGAEVGSVDLATAAGNAFLTEHNVPKNSGTLTVARPIRDVLTGAMVQPWEIEAGELVRIRGVEAYPDAFNTTTNDGQGVFRIHAVDYTTEGNTATLALDSDPRETEDALVMLMKARDRR